MQIIAHPQTETCLGSQLPWVILDQVVVHLSINQATLPRIHVFLSNLQTGLLVTQLTAGPANPRKSKSKHSDPNDPNDPNDDSLQLSGTSEQERSTSRWRWSSKPEGSLSRRKSKMLKMLQFDRSDNDKEGSISESPLRLQPEQGIEMSTTIYADGRSTNSASGKHEDREEWAPQSEASGVPIASLPKPLSRFNSTDRLRTTGSPTNGQDITINVQRTVEMTTETLDSSERPAHYVRKAVEMRPERLNRAEKPVT